MLFHGDVLPRSLLEAGFIYENRRVPLVGPQGIFKPAVMVDMPLSITTAPLIQGRPRPYEDEIGEGGVIRYMYRRTGHDHRDNVGLRRAMQTRTPLVYFHGVARGRYLAEWPTFVIRDIPETSTFEIQTDERHLANVPFEATPADEGRRAYVTALTRRRVHQASFRQRVILAYKETCAVCRLRHKELLDAAHILPDTHPKGLPVVPNGISLCKLHHAAFDQNIIGIRPDLIIEVSQTVLEEIDGPMLIHGLQGFHERSIVAPRARSHRPSEELLEERYELFRSAS